MTFPRCEVFTVGHSNRSIEEFLGLLLGFRIDTLVDIRRYPASRRFPHFNRSELEKAVEGRAIEYSWFAGLGGRRRTTGNRQENLALGNEGFRSYVQHMNSPDFRTALEQLGEIAERGRAALMCAELDYEKCHRRILSDRLMAEGVVVTHLRTVGESRPHVMSPCARFERGVLSYPLPLFSDQGMHVK